jgi:hypothetical protein
MKKRKGKEKTERKKERKTLFLCMYTDIVVASDKKTKPQRTTRLR